MYFEEKEVKNIAHLAKRFNNFLSTMPEVDIQEKIKSVAFEYLHGTVGYVSTYGVVFTFFNDHNGNRAVKFSLDPSLFRC